MYEQKLHKIMEAYEHMDEYPKMIAEKLEIRNIEWDEDDISNNPELSDGMTEEVDVEYYSEYEGDHSNRGESIDDYFREFYGCIPYSYDVSVISSETLDESAEGDGLYDECVVKVVDSPLYLMNTDFGYFRFSTNKDDAIIFNSYEEAENCIEDFKSMELEIVPSNEI